MYEVGVGAEENGLVRPWEGGHFTFVSRENGVVKAVNPCCRPRT